MFEGKAFRAISLIFLGGMMGLVFISCGGNAARLEETEPLP